MRNSGQPSRIMAHVEAQFAPFREVPRPVDVTDAAQFPEIARAIAHARAKALPDGEVGR